MYKEREDSEQWTEQKCSVIRFGVATKDARHQEPLNATIICVDWYDVFDRI